MDLKHVIITDNRDFARDYLAQTGLPPSETKIFPLGGPITGFRFDTNVKFHNCITDSRQFLSKTICRSVIAWFINHVIRAAGGRVEVRGRIISTYIYNNAELLEEFREQSGNGNSTDETYISVEGLFRTAVAVQDIPERVHAPVHFDLEGNILGKKFGEVVESGQDWVTIALDKSEIDAVTEVLKKKELKDYWKIGIDFGRDFFG